MKASLVLLFLILVGVAIGLYLALQKPPHGNDNDPKPATDGPSTGPSPGPKPGPTPDPLKPCPNSTDLCYTFDEPMNSIGITVDHYASLGIYIIQGPKDSKWSIVNTMQLENAGPASNGQFSDKHYAFLFLPDDYSNVASPINVGYYTTVAGLAPTPDGVSLPVYCLGDGKDALNTFWRSLENLTMIPVPLSKVDSRYKSYTAPFQDTNCTWAVSQASPIRRCKASNVAFATRCGDLSCYASGGFSADNSFSSSTGTPVIFAGQQQWLSLCDKYSPAPTNHSVWNQVYVGCSFDTTGVPDDHKVIEGVHGQNPYKCAPGFFSGVLTHKANVSNVKRARKPYFVSHTSETTGTPILNVVIPEIMSAVGYQDAVDESSKRAGFLVVNSQTSFLKALDGAASNELIRVIVFAPGKTIYLCRPVVVNVDNLTLVGLGVPIIQMATSDACLQIRGNNCRLSGMLLEAGSNNDTLLQWYGKGGLLHDVYTRVGGALPAQCVSCNTNMRIETGGSVTLENIWLWRADHDSSSPDGNDGCKSSLVGASSMNVSKIGLHVMAGASCVAFGLASEHHLDYNVLWEGSGAVYFYQSELPYCPPSGYSKPGFKVQTSGTDTFYGAGFGVYTFFPAQDITVPTAVDTKSSQPGSVIVEGVVTSFLNQTGAGGLQHTIDDLGCRVSPPDFRQSVTLSTSERADCSSRHC